ncbi:MAG: hypothetical protein MJE68_27450 [Proteobacteria bacterium]|nr:hypothetical protein [Pseudomonadota bacterium]
MKIKISKKKRKSSTGDYHMRLPDEGTPEECTSLPEETSTGDFSNATISGPSLHLIPFSFN